MNRPAGFVRLAAAAALFAAAVSGFATPALAWPDRPVKFIVPIGPGAGVDITARMFADRLSKKWGQPVVVENRPGGDAIVAITAFIGAKDDHTLLFGPSGSFTAHPYLHEKVPYDAKELSPVARVTSTFVGIAVPGKGDVTSLKELLDKARAAPGKLNWATATGLNDFLFAGYLKSSGLNMTKIPYRDTVSAINDLAEGRLDVYVGAFAIIRPHAQSGRVRIVAMTNRERSAGAPDVATVTELGVPGLRFDGLTGLFGQPGLPESVRAKIAADVREVAADPEILKRLTASGQAVIPGNSAEFAASVQEQRAQVDAVGKELGMKRAQ